MLIVDAHEDLAYNMLRFGRDYRLAAAETRRREGNQQTLPPVEDALLGWPDYQRGQVAVVFSTLFAAPARLLSREKDPLAYSDLNQANQLYRQQIDVYHRLVDESPEKFRLIESQRDLHTVLASWQIPAPAESEQTACPVGLIILMEGAEGVGAISELEDWWVRGLRIIGPAWAGNRFCGGTREPGALTKEGFALLEHMSGLGFCLDVSHMDEAAVLQAVGVYPGTIIASHSNARALLKGIEGNRHLTDRVITALLERDAVIGVVPFNAFLQVGWKHGERRDLVTLEHVLAQIDYICQLAGDAAHVGIGSDFDGGFGLQSVPIEIDTIADLQKLAPLLSEHGYKEADIAAIFGGNWINTLRRFLPD